MRATKSWARLQTQINAQCPYIPRVLAIHASTCAQPRKQKGLVPSLDHAGLREARVTASGAWTVSLTMPALFEPGDGAAFHVTAEGHSNRLAKED